MNSYKRSGNKWSVNETLSLQREYELLEWTVQEIATKHQRSVEAILYKLESEDIILSWTAARGFNSDKYQESCEDTITCDDDSHQNITINNEEIEEIEEIEENKLIERVWNLETSVGEISSMVKQMFNNWVSNKSQTSNRCSVKR